MKNSFALSIREQVFLIHLYCSEMWNVEREDSGKESRGKKRNSLGVQRLSISTFTAVALVQSLVSELGSCKPGSKTKKSIFTKCRVAFYSRKDTLYNNFTKN